MASSDTDVRRFLLAKEFGEVFQSQQFQPIAIRGLTQAYQSKHRKNFSPRKLGFSRNLDNFVDELPIFSRIDSGRVTLSRSKFIQFLFSPVLKQCGEITDLQRSPGVIAHAFKSCTGVEIESIYKVLQVSGIEELLPDLILIKQDILKVHVASGRKNEHLHGGADQGSRVENESLQQDGSSIQSSRKRRREAKAVESASPVHRDPPRMDVDEYPLLSRSPGRVLLPNPQPSHSQTMIGGPTPVQVLRPPPAQQPFPTQPLLQQATIPPRQQLGIAHPPHTHKQIIGPPHHNHERGAHLISHQQPYGAMGGGTVPVDPSRHTPSPHSGNVLPEYLSLSPGQRSTPRRVSSGSSPSLSPGPQPHVVPPQVITPHRQSPIVGHPSLLPPYQPPPTNEVVAKFPHANLALGQETVLPSHSTFRPNLPVPQTPSGATELSSSKKKRGSVTSDTSRQKVVDKINAKVEELISDLSSQGKFLQPDKVRGLVLEIIRKENYGRHDRIFYRDITAMADYSKVHGRIEELIKVFCWFSPVTSLHELELAIIESEKVDNYEALHLGPITKHPKVMDLFKLQNAASLDTVPDISAYKIQNYLMKFLSKRKRSEKQSLEGFLEYVREREFAESVYHLCIRITSFPLAIQVWKYRI